MRIKSFFFALATTLLLSGCGSSQNDRMEALKAQYDFAVSDTASITKIIISDKKPSRLVLEREGDHWVVGEGRHRVRRDAIEVLLETIGQVRMKNFVKESAIEVVNQRMDTYGKWVEVMIGDELVKHFIVGTETPDVLGTYYKLVGAELPFVVYIQGFNGYLSTRFFTEETLWRDRTIFGIGPEKIESLELYSPGSPGASWMITRKSGDDLGTLMEPAGSAESWRLVGGEFETLPVGNVQMLLQSVASVRTLKYEGAIIESDNIWAKKDSIFSSQPAFELSVHTVDAGILTVQAFYKKPEGNALGEEGMHQWDPDRFYAKLPDGRMVLIQRYGWQKVLKTAVEFAP
ncbi:MAG: hypothetical protein RL754_536 [Bacteroidota bacterium]|jgi:hypothetical protein